MGLPVVMSDASWTAFTALVEPASTAAFRLLFDLVDTTPADLGLAPDHWGRYNVQIGREDLRRYAPVAFVARTTAPYIRSATSWVGSTSTSVSPAASSPARYSANDNAPAMHPA